MYKNPIDDDKFLFGDYIKVDLKETNKPRKKNAAHTSKQGGPESPLM